MNDLVGKILSVAEEKIARIGITKIAAKAADADRSISPTERSIFERWRWRKVLI